MSTLKGNIHLVRGFYSIQNYPSYRPASQTPQSSNALPGCHNPPPCPSGGQWLSFGGSQGGPRGARSPTLPPGWLQESVWGVWGAPGAHGGAPEPKYRGFPGNLARERPIFRPWGPWEGGLPLWGLSDPPLKGGSGRGVPRNPP